ncbi:hypothetical protein Agub_g3614 [Astrephomene gubernaculifera]|uniref:Uncharacterized protein n=1 Tax=Astrephomene gubernaculifera TaxID=47775 RepID=A0AAD3DL07_9CHLO|nr:hypothetical protein Agub_g3614 [Astrephomene gubernaculifera]
MAPLVHMQKGGRQGLTAGCPSRSARRAPVHCSTRRALKVAAVNSGGPNHRVPFNTNVNAPPRIQLPGFLQPASSSSQHHQPHHNQQQQHRPDLNMTPPMEGAFKATGRTVVITGGSQGVGRAAALLFARKGYNVVVAAREAARLAYVADDCAAAAGRAGAALAVPTDVTQERQVQALVNSVLSKFERVDAVVQCAGVFGRGAVEDTPAMEARRLMEVNYLGPYLVTQAFLPVLLKAGARAMGTSSSSSSAGVGGGGVGLPGIGGLLGGGERPSLVFLTGFSGRVPTKHMGAFSASKAALESLAASLRTEVEGQGVHVGVVQPGLVRSNLMERAAFYGRNSEEDRRSFRQMLRTLPMAQSPGEVAEAIWGCVASRSPEVAVGLPFAAAAQAYRLTGINPSATPFT